MIFFSGVRPSSGAATFAKQGGWDLRKTFSPADIAVAEDGHTSFFPRFIAEPNHSVFAHATPPAPGRASISFVTRHSVPCSVRMTHRAACAFLPHGIDRVRAARRTIRFVLNVRVCTEQFILWRRGGG